MEKYFWWIFGGIFSIFGIGFLIGAIYSFTSTASFLKTATAADGAVISLKEVKETTCSTTDSGGACVGGIFNSKYYPIIEFRLPNEAAISFKSKIGGDPAPYLVGDKVRVLYNPTDPNNAQIDEQFFNWLLPIILGSVGLVLTVVGLVTIFFSIKKQRVAADTTS